MKLRGPHWRTRWRKIERWRDVERRPSRLDAQWTGRGDGTPGPTATHAVRGALWRGGGLEMQAGANLGDLL